MSCSYNWKCDKCRVYDDRYACPHFMGIKTYIPPVFRRKPKIKEEEEKKEEEEEEKEKKKAGRPEIITDEAILSRLQHGCLSSLQLAEALNCKSKTILRHCRRLIAAGKIRRVKDKPGVYHTTAVFEVVRNDNTNT